MDFMFDWENENDRFSFEDSERFEEDSLCSWISEPESLCNNWRGWKRQNGGGQATNNKQQAGGVSSLVELASKAVACHIPFEVVEHFPQPIPEQLQLRIAFWSFPENEEDIRLYSCLANGSADEFQKGEHLYKTRSAKEVLQIGFHLSASVIPPQGLQQTKGNFNVAVVFDRRRISSCTCTCNSQPSWCSHVVALCLYRIHQAPSVKLRAPVSESLSRLHRDQLQKFAQYLISELPQQILPTAQRLLDELLSSQENAMNSVCGAPDPTAGPSANEQTSWCLDESALHENVKKTLVKFCVPSPIVFSDVNYLSATAPPAAAEWQSLLRPLRGREPEGMWNLLSIVREMLRRNDSNAVPLLEIITDEVLQCEQILVWWFTTKITNNNNNIMGRGNGGSGSNATQHAASSLCDEIVTLWRLSALNPKLSPIQRDDLAVKFREWHISTIEKVKKARSSSVNGSSNSGIKKNDMENFIGFKPSIEACNLEWSDYPIPGITYSEKEGSCYFKYRFNKHSDKEVKKPSRIQAMPVCLGTIISTDNKTTLAQAQCMLQDAQEFSSNIRRNNNLVSQRDCVMNDGAISSGSEGFCEPERTSSIFRGDSDSGSEMKEVNSRSNSLDGPDLRNYAPELISSSFGLERSDNGVFSHGASNADEVFEGAEGGAEGGVEEMSIGMFGNEAGEQQMIDEVNAQSHRAENLDVLHAMDEYQIYYFNNPKIPEPPKNKADKSDEPNLFAGVKDLNSMQDILFSRAEALHAHGHTRDACRLAQKLAEELLSNPPDLLAETSNLPSLKGKKKKVLTSISLLASSILCKAAFLCSVLAEEIECHHLAFKVGMFGLEMPRPPASSKALEVKLAYQESEILNLLKKIPLGPAEVAVLREKAEELRDGTFKTRGDALLPLTLATFIFDSLCLPAFPVGCSSSRPPSRSVQITVRTSVDEKLGFDGAVAALGLKANVSEAEHPLLCESTRRQRGELAIAILVHYKDDPIKLSKIMDKLLDKEVHQLYKAPSLVNYLGVKNSSSNVTSTASSSMSTSSNPQASGAGAEAAGTSKTNKSLNGSAQPAVSAPSDVNPVPNRAPVGARPKITYPLRYNSGKDTDSSAVEEEDEVRALEAKLRCMAQKKKPSQGMASIDSSAPETTSSDNSPTLVRRTWSKHQGPGSDCGSSADSDSLGSTSSGEKDLRAKLRDNDSPPGVLPTPIIRSQQLSLESRSNTPNVKNTRFKGKSRMMPTVPNQPSEAIAHFMFELSKTVLGKAGGNSSTSLFTQPTSTNTTTGPHRNLHLCAFQIGVYALGLNNCVSPNWLSRTYSSHVSWITGQAIDIGSIAINILIDTWEGHLTPPEVASLADKASRGRDPAMVRAAADLALSCLPHAQALNPSEVQRAIFQCKEQSRDMLEKACLAVESAAKGGGVYPEVLFDVARQWFELSEEAAKSTEASNVSHNHSHADLDGDNSNSSSLVTERQSPQTLQVLPMSSSSNHQVSNQVMSHANPTLSAQPMVLSYTIPPANHHQLPHQALVQHIGYVQQLPPFGQQFTPQHLPIHGHNLHPYVTFPYQTQPPFNNLQLQGTPNVYSTNGPQFRPLGTAVQVFPPHSHCQINPIQCPPSSSAGGTTLQPIHQAEALVEVSSNSPSPPQQGSAQAHNGPIHVDNERQLNYLMASFRVGMLALETLSRRVHDDRPQTKYARNPPYGEDVKWLLGIAVKLGINYLQQFCASAVNAVVSPFVLYDIAIEAAHVLARSNPAVVQNHMRSNILNPLIQKCLNMFNQCAHQKIHHINQSDYDDFISTICSARNAFCLTPGGLVQFQELLQSLRRSKSCRKDLWTRILHALATGNV